MKMSKLYKQKTPTYLYFQAPVFGSEEYKQIMVVLFHPHSYRLNLDIIDQYYFSKRRFRTHLEETNIERVQKKILIKSNDDLYKKCFESSH